MLKKLVSMDVVSRYEIGYEDFLVYPKLRLNSGGITRPRHRLGWGLF